MIHIGNRIKQIAEGKGLNVEAVAKKLGVSSSAIYDFYRKPDASSTTIRKFAQAFNVKPYQFLLEDNGAKAEPQGIPIYDLDATAGSEELAQFPELVKGYINLPNFRKCIGFVNVRGDSMYPAFKAGDLIGLIPVSDMEVIQFGMPYLVVTKDDQRMIKYIQPDIQNDENIILKSHNELFPPIRISKRKIIKLYMIKGPVRDDYQ